MDIKQIHRLLITPKLFMIKHRNFRQMVSAAQAWLAKIRLGLLGTPGSWITCGVG